jgi:hypothetical protein
MTPQGFLLDRLIRFAAGLRFPRLLAITAVLFILDLIIPDMIPFADEILLGLLSLLLASLKKRGPGGRGPSVGS